MRGKAIGALSVVLIAWARPSWGFLGTELAPLLQLVSGQVAEIEKLTETIGVAKDQTEFLRRLNEGIDKTVSQIQSLQTIIERAQGLDPSGIRSLSDLNEYLRRARDVQAAVDEMLAMKVEIADQAIARSALQSETTYKMGQEMVTTGSSLAIQSETASPGRAGQITAAASSAQMLSAGVELQTMAQMVELQALLLEFQKTQIERELQAERVRRQAFQRTLAQPTSAKNRGRR